MLAFRERFDIRHVGNSGKVSILEPSNSLKNKVESKEALESLFEYATEGILIVDERGAIREVNPAALRMFDYKKEELVGQRVEVLVPDQLRKTHESHRDHYNKSPHARAMGVGMNLLGRKKDGMTLPVELSLSPYKTEEGNFVIAFIIDITLRKAAEDKLRSHASELENEVRKRTMILQEAVAQLEATKVNLSESLEKEKELNELKSRFVSMASHEFRTPLATILSSLVLLDKYAEKGDREKQTKHISRIKNSISSLTDILNDVLSLSRLEEGRIEANIEETDIKTLAEEITQDFRNLLKKGQVLEYKHTGKSVLFPTDKKIFKNILVNLLSNAIKFSPEGRNILLSTEITGKTFSVAVKDEGLGIPAEDQENLFERFFRGKNVTNIQGTGLGLNIVLRYMELLGGEISFISELGKGTTFNLNFEK